MDEIERALLGVLTELEQTVEKMARSNPKPDLQLLFERIDELGGQLPPDADPDLRHYLQRKSYEKARLFLQGRQTEIRAGGCGA